MTPQTRIILAASLAFALATATIHAADHHTQGMNVGTPAVKSAGPLAFGPEGILFVADTRSAAIFAIATGDTSGGESVAALEVSDLGAKLASMLGTTARDIQITDVIVNPASGKAYVSVMRGRGPDAIPVIFRVSGGGKIEPVSLENVNFSKATLPNAMDNAKAGQRQRGQSITDLAYVDGQVFVAGLSNEEFASNLRSIPFPFGDVDRGTSVEIYHAAHGRWETRSPIRTFVPYEVKSEAHLLAAYTCTPLVKFPISELKPGTKVVGTTLAELGNRNRPLDMIVYTKGGVDYILMSNSSRGVMKIPTEPAADQKGLTEPVRGGNKAGLGYETIESLQGVQQLDRLDATRAVILVRAETGSLDLKTIALP